ncbi:hypothetical protein TraAM80_09039 [Trypanosoma rangeli]|uniref:Uncharacterized protein n=1 Tax=Trypanosoma rangeli TaxID=5698 RepID=A0A422MXL2_TRYRA|nr:uncharacterized protein TraAM80_09039 [Trypanosoma rangeli]RNE97972.1 hypothetical protein TraAM80_09039 [Trypanosoma rangeli]|eukprot:RNE97972.1 hypothetical protein TraAM80_09039 [Trypanosoma rangeli]
MMGKTEVKKSMEKSAGGSKMRQPHALTAPPRKKETSWQKTWKRPAKPTTSEASKKDEAATAAVPPRDEARKLLEGNQEAAEETVTLSSSSFSASSNVSRLTSSSSHAPGYGTALTAAEKQAAGVSPATTQTEEEIVTVVPTDALTNKLRNEQVLYYLEAARSLRQVTTSMEAQERFMGNEIQRGSALHDAKKTQLAERQKVLDRLQESTLRLTRQLRGLDSENDRMRDRLAQLQAAVDKAGSRRAAPFHVQRDVNPVVRHNSMLSRQRVSDSSGGGAPIVPVRKSLSFTRNALMAELDAYSRKLRTAEEQHEELLKELQLAVAKRKGRAAAYSSSGVSWAFSGYPKTGSRESSFFTDSVKESSALQQLERMIDDSLVRCL